MLEMLIDIGVGIMTALAVAALAWGAWLSLTGSAQDSREASAGPR